MVLGLRTKNRKGTSVQVDYLIHVEEIKPWPPSQALKSLRSVMLQWENGDRNSGTINPVIPSLGSGVGDGKIEFNESFRLGVTLSKEVSVKGGDAEVYQKNCIQFNLYEPRRDKTVKGQHLGTVIVDLAEYGIVKEPLIVSAPLNCKRSFRNAVQSLLFIKIQPYDKHSSSTLLKETLSKEASLDKEGKESVSALMNVEYADEAEVASFTDDDGSSHSSATVSSSVFEATGSSPPQNDEDALEAVKNDKVESTGDPDLPLELIPEKSEVKPVIAAHKQLNGGSSRPSSTDLSSRVESPETDHASLSNFQERSLTSKSHKHSAQSSSPSIAHEGAAGEAVCNNNLRNFVPDESDHEVHGNIFDGESTNKENARHSQEENNTKNLASSDANLLVSEKVSCSMSTDSEVNGEDNWKGSEQNRSGSEKAAATTYSLAADLAEDKDDAKWRENGQIDLADTQKAHSSEYESFSIGSQDVNRKPASMDDAPQFSKRGFRVKGYSSSNDRLRHVKSVRSLLDASRSCSSLSDNHFIGDTKDAEIVDETCGATSLSDRKVQECKSRIEKLEGELREAAAVEVALYSIVAEHGSSVNKVHAPARRLSRLYLHGSKQGSQVSRASAARSAISGLVLVAKACGNDVPRLTFWMSNSVVLRAIISRALGDSQLPISAGPRNETNGGAKENGKKSSSLAWKKTSPEKNKNMLSFVDNLDDWEDPLTLIVALEKIEAWIFSRVVESIWWQTLTPHMQPTSRRGNEQRMSSIIRKNYGRKSSLCGEEQANFSLELWKNAFNDACERLCPVRASGHECGCLPVLARLVMEQCVHRLDVAMFNALLRESADEIPTDPVSDPISDSSVLPIPAGTSSFGSGAQLKNAIGNWSRWLTDLFGLDDDILHQGENEDDAYDREESAATSKSFHLLNALSDLMMLPKDMLLERSIRKEVCPTFSAPLIKRILHNFVPDEFCPDPIPKAVFEVLDAEDPLEEEEIRNFPHNATPVVYSPPSAALLQSIIGEIGNESQLRRSGSSVLRKSYTSDDELDELDSPLSSIFIDSPRAPSTPNWPSKENGGRNVVRYQLLREVWRDED